MINFIENILSRFESCFSRKAAFGWFVILITGLMLRSDHLGITSVIRDLALRPSCYDTMLHFFLCMAGLAPAIEVDMKACFHTFRASSWNLDAVRTCWFHAVKGHVPLYMEGAFHVLVGDGARQPKEGRRMPGVKKLYQESENSAKPEYIHGHMFRGLGVLAGGIRKWACIPLSIRLHDGLQAASGWEGAAVSSASHVVQMVRDAYRAASVLGDSILLLDRYFLTVPALETLGSLNKEGSVRMEVVTKAKRSCVAYGKPDPRRPGRGRPPKKGAPVHMKELFASHAGQFQETDMELYGKKERVRYYSVDLLWGQKLYQELRFVLVDARGAQSILASTSLTLDPLDIIRLYSYRFRIGCTFWVTVHTQAVPRGVSGHFARKSRELRREIA